MANNCEDGDYLIGSFVVKKMSKKEKQRRLGTWTDRSRREIVDLVGSY